MTFEEFLSKFEDTEDTGLVYFNYNVLHGMDLQEVCSVLGSVGILHLFVDNSEPGSFRWKRIIDNKMPDILHEVSTKKGKENLRLLVRNIKLSKLDEIDSI